MKYKHKSVSIYENTKFTFHPLTEKLFKSITHAYHKGDQNEYLAETRYFRTILRMNLVTNVLFVLSEGSGTNAYQIIGGCFNPLFLSKKVKPSNTILISCFHNINTTELRPKELRELKQDIIDFIYLDFTKTVSILSVKKIGVIVKEVSNISKMHRSGIWNEIMINDRDYVTQKELSKLLDVSINIIHKHTQDSV